MTRFLAITIAVVSITTAAAAQSVNIEWGDRLSVPDPTYAAAGLPGAWNNLDGAPGPHALVGLDGAPIAATAFFHPGTSAFGFDHPQTTGNAEALMDDAVGGLADIVGTVSLSRLEPGRYRILTYAWVPYDETNIVWVWVNDGYLTNRVQALQGPWIPGGPVEGVHYAAHTVTIPGGRVEVSLVSGLWVFSDWWLNGMQLVRVGPVGDLNCDGVLDAADAPAVALALADPVGYAAQYPGCDADAADVNGDGSSDGADLQLFVASLLAP